MHGSVRRAISTALLALLLPVAALAQDATTALRKSDLIRYLTGNTYSQSEIAAIVRRNCLAFAPTARDRDDLRQLGASEEILAAVDRCARSGPREAGTSRPRARPAGPADLSLAMSAVSAPAGTIASVVARVQRGGQPVSGVRLVLRGTRAIPGGAPTEISTSTDEAGRATFAVPAGTATGSYRLTIAATDDTRLRGAATVTLTTLPAAPSTAELRPPVVAIVPGEDAEQSVVVAVSDAFGNPIADRRVELRPGDSASGFSRLSLVSDDSGTVTFHVPTARLRDQDTLSVVVADRAIAVLPVSATGQVAAQMLQAARLEAAGQPAAAEAVYDSVLQAQPHDVRALLGRGYVRAWARKDSAARADFLAVLREDGADVAALTGLGYSFAREGDYEKAERRFEQALDAEPHNSAAETGLTYVELWRYDPRQAARRADVLDAARPTAYPSEAASQFRGAIAALQEGKLLIAELALTRAIAAAPSWPDAYYTRALVYDAEGRPDHATQDFEKYLQLRPAASDRAAVAKRAGGSGRGPGTALALGLAVPGVGQFYARQPALGLLVIAGVAGGAVWGLQTKTTMEERTFPLPFGDGFYTDTLPVQKRPHFTAGMAVAGTLWVLGAVEAYLHAKGTRVGGPALPASDDRSAKSPLGSPSFHPVLAFTPGGPAFGAGVAVPFRW